ncbi:MAG TPA: molybdenum cofactor guanylyltransferase [Kofleriaceae bacterium]|jgi:molybdopterin-guanine dinucleotide biosynthesis protein A
MLAVSALILAGGRAARMGGIDKTAIVVDGESIFQRQVRVLAPLVSEIIVSARADISGYRCVRDVADAVGPLAGITAGLEVATTEWLLVIAGDMPYISEPVIRLLFDRGGDEASAFRIAGRPEPLFSLLRVEPAKRAAHELIAQGQMRAAGLLEALRVAWVDEDALRAVDPALASVKSINTPADL